MAKLALGSEQQETEEVWPVPWLSKEPTESSSQKRSQTTDTIPSSCEASRWAQRSSPRGGGFPSCPVEHVARYHNASHSSALKKPRQSILLSLLHYLYTGLSPQAAIVFKASLDPSGLDL